MTNILGSSALARSSPTQMPPAFANAASTLGALPPRVSSPPGLFGQFGANTSGLTPAQQASNIYGRLNPANVAQLTSFAQSLTQPQMDYMRVLHQQTATHLPYDFWHQNVGIPHIVNNFQSFPSGFFSPQQLDSLNSLAGGLTLT